MANEDTWELEQSQEYRENFRGREIFLAPCLETLLPQEKTLKRNHTQIFNQFFK